MTTHRFPSPDAAVAEVERLRQAGRLQNAIGLARLAATQFPGRPELHRLLGDLYAQVGQQAMAKRERIVATRFVAQLQQAAQAAAAVLLPAVAAAVPARPRLAGLLGSLLRRPEPQLPAVLPQQRQELLELVGPLVAELVQLEAQAGPETPAALREALHDGRQALMESASTLRHQLAQGPAGAEVSFGMDIGPPGHAHCSTGPEVLALQRLLRRQNYPVVASSTYDQATQKAVMALQARYGVKRTGIVDAATRDLLNRIVHRHDHATAAK